VGWALGVVTSAVALGGAIGPVVGGIAGSIFGLRLVFLGGGILLLLSLIPVIIIVRESPMIRRAGPRLNTIAVIEQKPGLRRQLAVLIGAQGLISVCNSATQQLVVLRLLEMLTSGVAALSGVGFGLAGVASSAAAVGYTRVTKRLGYVRTAAAAAGMVALAVGLIGIAPWAALVVAGIALNGLFSGVVIPATASMIGLDTPPEAQSTVFGLNASSVAFGFFLGPLIAGTVAAVSGVQSALFVIGVLALVLAATIAAGAREPTR
jgi:MFS family permease